MNTVFSNFGQVFDGDRLYYSVETKGDFYFISSERKRLTISDMTDKGIRFPNVSLPQKGHFTSFLRNLPWTPASIDGFLTSPGETIDPRAFFQQTRDLTETFCPFREDQDLLFLTLFIILTGWYSVFCATPYPQLMGNHYLSQLVSQFLERVCFNGISLPLPCESIAARITTLHGGCLIIHGPDKLWHQKSGKQSLSFLWNGNRSTGCSYVLNECSIPTPLSTYSPKILIGDVDNSHLKVPIVEILIEEVPDISDYLHLEDWEDTFQAFRDSHHIFCLQTISDLHTQYRSIEKIAGLPNQDTDSMAGIFALAKYFDSFYETPFLFDNMVSMAKRIASQRQYDEKFDDPKSHKLLLTAEFIQRFTPMAGGYYVAEHIAKYISESGDLFKGKKLRPGDITKPLKGFIAHRKRDRPHLEGPEDKRQRTFIKLKKKKLLEYVKKQCNG